MTECPKCKSKEIVNVQYAYTMPEHYDGVSEIDCRKCGYRQGRWCGHELKENMVEPRFCTYKGVKPCVIHFQTNEKLAKK